MTTLALDYATLFFLGLLAGIEFLVMFGVRGPLRVLAAEPQIEMRQALVRRLRIVVPMVSMTAFALCVAATVVQWRTYSPEPLLRGAGLGCIGVWLLATFFGTVPINKALLGWDAASPPTNWHSKVKQWEGLDTVRMLTAVTAFALFLAATLFNHAPA